MQFGNWQAIVTDRDCMPSMASPIGAKASLPLSTCLAMGPICTIVLLCRLSLLVGTTWATLSPCRQSLSAVNASVVHYVSFIENARDLGRWASNSSFSKLTLTFLFCLLPEQQTALSGKRKKGNEKVSELVRKQVKVHARTARKDPNPSELNSPCYFLLVRHRTDKVCAD